MDSHIRWYKNPARGHKVGKTPSGREKRATYSPYKEKTIVVQNYQKILGKSNISKEKEEKGRNTCGCWDEERMHITGRRTIERRAAASVKT